MKNSIEHLSLMFNTLESSDYKTFDEIKNMKNIMGVYIIYTEEDELLYIGNTNNFNVRFGTDLRHESTHTLIRKLIKENIHIDRKAAREYFTFRYKYKTIVCETKRQAEALEHVAIWIMNRQYNTHYITE